MIGGQRKLTPCSPGDPTAIEKTWMEVEAEELEAPVTNVKDFLKAIKMTRPSVSADDLQKNSAWTKEFGSDGGGSEDQPPQDPAFGHDGAPRHTTGPNTHFHSGPGSMMMPS